jgi:two-component system chemotaxis response regulator CheB
MTNTINILIVDDSRIYRGLVEKALANQESIKIIGSVMNGVKAIEFIRNNPITPHIVTLDLEMPEMDGLQTLEEIEKINKSSGTPPIACIMVSAFTQQGSETTMKALEAGAYDFVGKPQLNNPTENLNYLKNELLKIIKSFSPANIKISTQQTKPPLAKPSISKNDKIQVILIGCSTGGPKALMSLLPPLCDSTNLPIIVVQHMPENFTASLAESLNKKCSHNVLEVQGDEEIVSDNIYIAKGGKHLVLRESSNGKVHTGLNEQPPENGCRPAVDVLFRSSASLYGPSAIAVVLTGMGSDGCKGIAPLYRAGAHIIAQDEASSVVWGMPGSAVASGKVHEILSLDSIANAISRKCK